MTARVRAAAAIVLAGAAMTAIVDAQGRGRGNQGQQPPPDQPPGGGRRGGFTQFTRPLAPQDVIVRGKGLYEANCAGCHAVDLRGGASGTNLLRSGTALRDQHGELIAAAVAKHTPALTLAGVDTTAIAEYIHSVHAVMGGQGSPPGRNPAGLALNVLTGDPKAGAAYFARVCSRCHSVTGDLKGIGAQFDDARMLQNAWVSGAINPFGTGARGGAAGGGNPAVVTMPDGSKIEGTLVRKDDFLVVVMLPDGTRKSIARQDGVPAVAVTDPKEPHKRMILELDDPENKTLHDVTAYLATIK